MNDVSELLRSRKYDQGRTWSAWPAYEAAESGLLNYWYPAAWASEIGKNPTPVRICAVNIMLMRDEEGQVRALRDRCPHRGVKLSQGIQEFPNTISCPYHGWTYRLSDGELVAVITDGPDSRICGAVAVQTFAAEERLGLVWVFVGNADTYPLDKQLPEELVDAPPHAVGGRIENRSGNWRFYAENGFDEGHAKYLHRTSLWRTFKMMPTWNKIHIEKLGRWLYRVEDERYWEAEFPGVGKWSNDRWWKIKPKQHQGRMLGNTGGSVRNDPYIAGLDLPGFASLSLPGVLRIAYPQFIHYEFYVPIDSGHTKYVGVMVQFKSGLAKAKFYLKYLLGIRWLFHGQFSGQDHWMVEQTDAPPERLYRPDVSLIEWRRLFDGRHAITGEPTAGAGHPSGATATASTN
ncbi:(2Fe-2S)-binding protein [Tardibacter chloracetimidivorans]|uniref:(2Fe-2S)-binding protein n=1 Tax=Tardibacter chloracetimidivorans TaxID=1921510 RepID=A0A1L3ZW30_9SPHN|nr:Rieske 2Fe-2S domain-containing protein [Tardibacter chloracetimidivorans]API59838.1 (2Fe-2S)-binding protein [Tardibacter chloracetimidivorans]